MPGSILRPLPPLGSMPLFTDLLERSRRAVSRPLALPSQCAVCHAWQGHRLCRDCVGRFGRAPPRCRRCAIEVPAGTIACGACLLDPPPFDACVAAADHAWPWHRLVAQLKFRESLDLLEPLGQRLLQALAARQQDDPLPAPDWIVPVPLAGDRLAERGYNQAWELARWLASRRPLPPGTARADARLTSRLRTTPHQLALTAPARRANMRGAFMVEPARAAELAGTSVALVDDVLTTGATAAELARQFKLAGARHVQVWVLTRTPRPGAGP